MRVPQLRGQVELEVLCIVDMGVSEFYSPGAALLNNLLLQQGLNCRIQLLVHVFNHYRVSNSDGVFKDFKVVVIGELENLDLSLLFHASDPLVGLALRINEKGPSSSLLGNYGIFD